MGWAWPAERLIRPIIRDPPVGLAVPDVDFIGPVGICLAAARRVRSVGLHQGLVPLADGRIRIFPLTKIARVDARGQITGNT